MSLLAFLETLSPEQRIELNRVVIAAKSEEDEPVTVRDCLSGWAYEVGRLGRDALLSGEDYHGWTEWDWLAILYNRSRVEREVSRLSQELRAQVIIFVGSLDEVFLDLTEADTGGESLAIAAELDGNPITNAGWWWHRIPKRGSIRECIDESAEHAPD